MQAWQVLPLVPPERGFWSPYSGLDAMCGFNLLIGLDELADEGLIDKEDLPEHVPVSDVDYKKVCLTICKLLHPRNGPTLETYLDFHLTRTTSLVNIGLIIQLCVWHHILPLVYYTGEYYTLTVWLVKIMTIETNSL